MSHMDSNSKVPIRIRERYLQIILRFAKCGPPCEGRGRWIMDYGIFRLRPTQITLSNLNLIGLFASKREARSFHLSGGSLSVTVVCPPVPTIITLYYVVLNKIDPSYMVCGRRFLMLFHGTSPRPGLFLSA